MQVFVMVNNVGINMNADASAKSWLAKGCVIKDLFGTLGIVNMNGINHVMLENI